MPVTASELRANIYKLLDQALETGLPIEVERKGKLLRITPVTAPSKLERLQPRPEFIRGDPDELIRIDWSSEWKP